MRICAIYNVWVDGNDLLSHSINNILPVVDGVIVVWSECSNYGVNAKTPIIINLDNQANKSKVQLFQCEPNSMAGPQLNETRKRNHGLDQAKKMGFDHFIMMDADEFYKRDEFVREKFRMEQEDLNGLVCPLKVLFRSPTLWCSDHTLVPFIQKLEKDTTVGNNHKYPFAYDENGRAHIDPTRRPSHTTKVQMSEIFMYHASWVRSNFDLKIANSSAAKNLKRSSIYKDLAHAAEGYYCEFYREKLQKCDNYFNLPEL